MPNYQNGKIYKIINPQNEVIYIGSTAQEKLCKRFSTHPYRGNGNRIILLEHYSCNCREELVKKEQEVIEQHENLLNQMRAYNSEEYQKEYYKEYNEKWRINNKEKYKEQKKRYCQKNKEKMKEYNRTHYQENKEKMKEYYKEYYKENKNEISEKNKVKVLCDCGCDVVKKSLSRHIKTRKHIDLMNTITE